MKKTILSLILALAMAFSCVGLVACEIDLEPNASANQAYDFEENKALLPEDYFFNLATSFEMKKGAGQGFTLSDVELELDLTDIEGVNLPKGATWAIKATASAEAYVGFDNSGNMADRGYGIVAMTLSKNGADAEKLTAEGAFQIKDGVIALEYKLVPEVFDADVAAEIGAGSVSGLKGTKTDTLTFNLADILAKANDGEQSVAGSVITSASSLILSDTPAFLTFAQEKVIPYVESVIKPVFTQTATFDARLAEYFYNFSDEGNGYVITPDYTAYAVLANDVATMQMKALVDKYCGAGAYDTLKALPENVLNLTMGEIVDTLATYHLSVSEIRTFCVDAFTFAKVDNSAIATAVEILNNLEVQLNDEAFRALTVKYLLVNMAGIPEAQITQYSTMITTVLTAVENKTLTEVIDYVAAMTGATIDAETKETITNAVNLVTAELAKVMVALGDMTSVKFYTAKDGAFQKAEISINANDAKVNALIDNMDIDGLAALFASFSTTTNKTTEPDDDFFYDDEDEDYFEDEDEDYFEDDDDEFFEDDDDDDFFFEDDDDDDEFFDDDDDEFFDDDDDDDDDDLFDESDDVVFEIDLKEMVKAFIPAFSVKGTITFYTSDPCTYVFGTMTAK